MPGLTLEELFEILGEFTDLGDTPHRPDLVLGEDIPIDSQDLLRAVARIEARTGLRFRPDEILSMGTTGDVLEVVDRASGRRGSAGGARK